MHEVPSSGGPRRVVDRYTLIVGTPEAAATTIAAVAVKERLRQPTSSSCERRDS
jgi:hypothetical protein